MNACGFQVTMVLIYLPDLRVGQKGQVVKSPEYFRRASFVHWDCTEREIHMKTKIKRCRCLVVITGLIRRLGKIILFAVVCLLTGKVPPSPVTGPVPSPVLFPHLGVRVRMGYRKTGQGYPSSQTGHLQTDHGAGSTPLAIMKGNFLISQYFWFQCIIIYGVICHVDLMQKHPCPCKFKIFVLCIPKSNSSTFSISKPSCQRPGTGMVDLIVPKSRRLPRILCLSTRQL